MTYFGPVYCLQSVTATRLTHSFHWCTKIIKWKVVETTQSLRGAWMSVDSDFVHSVMSVYCRPTRFGQFGPGNSSRQSERHHWCHLTVHGSRCLLEIERKHMKAQYLRENQTDYD